MAGGRTRNSASDPASGRGRFSRTASAAETRRSASPIRTWPQHSSGSRDGGRDAFYKGPIAAAIVADMKQARRSSRHARFRRARSRTGSSRSRPTTAATTSTRCRPIRRASSSLEMLNILEGFDLARWATTRRSTCTAGRGQANRVRRSGGVSGRSRLRPAGRAANAHLEGLRGVEAQRHRSRAHGRTVRASPRRRPARACRPVSAGGPQRGDSESDRPRSRRHDLPDRRGRPRQCRLAHPIALLGLRRRHRRGRHRHRAAQPRQRFHAHARGTRTGLRAAQATARTR